MSSVKYQSREGVMSVKCVLRFEENSEKLYLRIASIVLMISGYCEWKLQISLQFTSNNRRRQQQNNSSSNNNTITCISTTWTSTSSIIAYETFTVHFTSTEYLLQRVGVKVGCHFLSPRCFSFSKGRWLNHLELQDHSVSVGVWCVLESQGFM